MERLPNDERVRIARYLVGRCARLRGVGRDALDWDDLNGEIHLAICEAEHRYQPDKGMKLENWVITRVPNIVFDRGRMVGRMGRNERDVPRYRAALTTALSIGVFDDEEAPDIDPEDIAAGEAMERCEGRIDAADVAQQARALAADDRAIAVVTRLTLDGDSYLTIASALGVSESRVSQLYKRGLEHLRERIAA